MPHGNRKHARMASWRQAAMVCGARRLRGQHDVASPGIGSEAGKTTRHTDQANRPERPTRRRDGATLDLLFAETLDFGDNARCS
jgi:hypothetical protein